MGLQFYNTYSNQIESFKEIKKGEVGLYTCGPTVYDFAHIGNFRSYVFEDLVKRYLLYSGYKVNHIMNITDIDDKTIKKMKELNITLNQVTGQYTEAFFNDIATLNIIKADVYPKATEHINEMIDLIKILEEKGYAYQKGNSVYFRIEKFSEYGKLANVNKENLQMSAASGSDEYDKENIQDFVLWKGKKEGEPSWETPYGEGRPGWHIECSAMSSRYLGDHFDIHMGGVDNIFPHHENEIAQSCAATGKPFVNFWIHCQHLIIDNQKMSKSLGNFYTLKDLMEMGHEPMSIRYLLITTHYRKLLNFTLAGIESAKQSLKRIHDFLFAITNLETSAGKSDSIINLINQNEIKFKESMDDDFNVSGALGTLFDFLHQVNREMSHLKSDDVSHILSYIDRINSVLGIIQKQESTSVDQEIMAKIEIREKARKEKNYQLADQIRNELKSQGISLIDTPDGVKWKLD